MIVEIGTSDFKTSAGVRDGLFIEPVKYYFDRLPKCRKENIAISNYEGEIDVYYMTEDDINKHDLPNWIRGCNKIGEPHPSTIAILNEKKLDSDLIRKHTVEVKRIKSVLDKYHIKKINFLKIDTEGHDCIILNDFFDTVDILPRIIQFENNSLSDINQIKHITDRIIKRGYEMKYSKGDVICRL